jgi:hypothetical protein
MSIAKATIHVRSQRRESLEAAKSLAESLETRLRECQLDGALLEWRRDVMSSVHNLLMQVEQKISGDGE